MPLPYFKHFHLCVYPRIHVVLPLFYISPLKNIFTCPTPYFTFFTVLQLLHVLRVRPFTRLFSLSIDFYILHSCMFSFFTVVTHPSVLLFFKPLHFVHLHLFRFSYYIFAISLFHVFATIYLFLRCLPFFVFYIYTFFLSFLLICFTCVFYI